MSFLVSLPVLNFILMMEKVLKLSRLLSSVGAGPGGLFLVILYTQPEILLVTIPLGFLFAVLYTYGRMNADNELLVLRGSGMSFRQIAMPVFFLGGICVILGFLVSFELAPSGKRNSRLEVAEIFREKASQAIEPGVFSNFIKDTVMYVENSSDGILKGVFIFDERNKQRPVAIYAREGKIAPAKEEDSFALSLKDGLINTIKEDRLTEVFFGSYYLVLPLQVESPDRKLGELTPGELLKEAQRRPEEKRAKVYLEFDKRLTFPLFSLAMMFLAPVLSLYSGKRARLGGIAMGTMVFTLYYIMLTYMEKLAQGGAIPHILGGWLPLLLLFAISILSFRKVNRR